MGTGPAERSSYASEQTRAFVSEIGGRTDLHANSLERHLSPHRERIELRTGIACVGGADLPGNVAVQIVEHEADVAVDVPVQRRRIDGLSSTGDAVGGGELIVEIDRADTPRNFPRAPTATGQ